MGDFFSEIYSNIRQPDVTMNDGPLPPRHPRAPPTGINGVPDARIDFTSSLLGDHIDAYSYGKADRLSTQTAYLNVPHAVQRVVPQLYLPEAHTPPNGGGGLIPLSHQVDDGDIAFVLRLAFHRMQSTLDQDYVHNRQKFAKAGQLHAIDSIVNLPTVNYLLHGLQRYGTDAVNHHWYALAQAFKVDDVDKTEAGRKKMAVFLCKYLMTPFGIPRGSEKQGGQHQGLVNKSVTWPVDYVISMVVDGKVINLRNLWHGGPDVSCGDDLCLHLKKIKIDQHRTYTLTHHPKSQVTQTFQKYEAAEQIDYVWQLVPIIRRMCDPDDHDIPLRWHIARTQQMQKGNKRKKDADYACNAATNLNDPVLTAVFSPGLEILNF